MSKLSGKLHKQPGYLLRRAYQKGVALFLEKTSTHNITPLQFAVLAALKELGPSTQRRISQHIDMEPSNVHPMLRRMKDHQFITIDPDPNDKRRSIISMTKEGQNMLEQVWPLELATSKTLLSNLSKDEQQTFLSLLNKIGE